MYEMKSVIRRMVIGIAMMSLLISFVNSKEVYASDGNVTGEYIYIDSLEQIDNNELMNGIIYVIPNENLKGEKADINYSRTTRDVNKIPTEIWDVSTQGTYEFDGSSSGGGYDIYTDYCFNGSDSYTVQLTNQYTQAVTAKCKTVLKTYRTCTVEPGMTTIFNVINVTSTTKWYIYFGSPCDVWGFVKG